MKLVAFLLVVASLPSLAQSGKSSFGTVQFGDIVQVDLPRNWTYLDKKIADHLNTSSEAIARLTGLALNQGDNTILVAANAYDKEGTTRATIRVSVRAAPAPNQATIRELEKQPPLSIEAELRPMADETVKTMLKVPGVKSYKVRGVKLDRNNSLVCFLSSFEGDLGRGPRISDTWVCPVGARTIKLSTSYDKSLESIYRPTIEYVWRSLKVPVPK